MMKLSFVPITFSKKISVLICFPRNISSVCICVTYVELKHAVRAFEIYFFFRLKLQKKTYLYKRSMRCSNYFKHNLYIIYFLFLCWRSFPKG